MMLLFLVSFLRNMWNICEKYLSVFGSKVLNLSCLNVNCFEEKFVFWDVLFLKMDIEWILVE